MHNVEQLFFVLFVLTIIVAIDFFFLTGSYGILRLLRISVHWITWIKGYIACAY